MRVSFTIRDLLWLTALVAVTVGWWIDHRNGVVQRNQLSEKVANLENLASLQSQLSGLYERHAILEREYQQTSSAFFAYIKQSPERESQNADAFFKSERE